MNLITNFVKPKLQSFVGKKEVPDNLWETCPKCSQMILKRELKAALYVCKHCDHHFRINAKDRLESFFGNNFMIIETPKIKSDPLKFKDSKKYVDRLKKAKKNTELEDSVLVASGTLNKIKVTVAIFDFNFMGGSMGMAAGEAIVTACNYAKKNNYDLLITLDADLSHDPMLIPEFIKHLETSFFNDFTLADDGTHVVLPKDSKEIKISNIN